MKCYPENVLLEYVEGNLPAEEEQEVDAHLVTCVLCRGLVEDIEDELED